MILLTGSSAFKSVVYYEETKKMVVQYNAGTLYLYDDIEIDEVQQLSSNSKGSMLHKIIQNKTVTAL